jgi:hypothetical protein
MNKRLLFIFSFTVIISLFAFIYFKGYNGMFDSFKKERMNDTVKVENIIKIKEVDTIKIYRVIVGSFKSYENALKYSERYEYSDILPITDSGFYRVSKYSYFDLESAKKDKKSLNSKSWILKDDIYFEK